MNKGRIVDYIRINYLSICLLCVGTSAKAEDATPPHDVLASHLPPFLMEESNFVLWATDGCTRIDRQSLPPPAIDHSDVWVSLAGNEYESFHLAITPRSNDVTVSLVTVSDLRNKNGAILAASNVVIKYIGEVSGTQAGTTNLIGPYPDVRFPLAYDTVAEMGQNYVLHFTVLAPPGTDPGQYTGQITMTVDSNALSIPLAVQVWPFELPRTTTVNTMLMGMWLADMDYHYGLEPWGGDSQRMKQGWAETMASLRFSPAELPVLPRIRWEEFPAQVPGFSGKALSFPSRRHLTIAGPRFEDLGPDFSISFQLNTKTNDLPSFLSQRWPGRPSGYSFDIRNGNLLARVGTATQATLADETSMKESTATTLFPSDSTWHAIALVVATNAMSLYLDGKLQATTALHEPLSPAYAQVTLAGAGFSIDELRWSDSPLSDAAVDAQAKVKSSPRDYVSAYSFDGPNYDFRDRVSRQPPDQLDSDAIHQWAQWTKDHGLFVNNVTVPEGWSLDRYDAVLLRPLLRLGLGGQVSVKLPHDEACEGPKAKENIAFATEFRRRFPDIRLYHTVGAMGGRRNPWARRQEQLEHLDASVDIWGMRPVILDTYWDSFFKPRIAEGDAVAPYIHLCDQVENPQVLLLSRNYFYHLFQRNIKATTYWAVNMWYQPVKARGIGSRAERVIWPVPNGYRASLRNWTGITAGMLFYPLPDGPEPSLIALSWRDGLEDYEYLTLLQQRLSEAEARDANNSAVTRAKRLIAEIRATNFVQDRWTRVPSVYSGQLPRLRNEIALSIIELTQLHQKKPL